MGNVVRNKDDFNYLCNIAHDIVDNEVDKGIIEDILIHLLPKDSNGQILVGYNVREGKGKAGAYYPKFNIINISVPGLKEWVLQLAKILEDKYDIKEVQVFKAYLYLYVLLHEIEHSYQFLIGSGKVPAPCKMIEQGYRTITELFVATDTFFPRPIKKTRALISWIAYNCKAYYYVMERNAEVTAFGIVADIALANGHDESYRIFLEIKQALSIIGYTNNNDGTLINTIKGILMGDKLRKMDHDYESMDMMERYEWGLPIDQETRKKVLTKAKTTHDE